MRQGTQVLLPATENVIMADPQHFEAVKGKKEKSFPAELQ